MKTRLLLILFLFPGFILSIPERFRLIAVGDCQTEMLLLWQTGASPRFAYDTQQHPNFSDYSSEILPDVENHWFGTTAKVHMKDLQPGTRYFFVVMDQGGVERLHFQTCGNDLSIIAGGDSRSNRSPRQKGNLIAGQLRPDLIIFSGDYTVNATGSQIRDWLDDWQMTISGGRIFPLVPARGNHEWSDDLMSQWFGIPSSGYYITHAGARLSVFILNTQAPHAGAQAFFLANALQESDSKFQIISYHKPMRSHVSGKPEGLSQQSAWAGIIEAGGVDLVVEGDGHCVKRTWPLSVDVSGEEGFRRAETGPVYIGEGTWGAPLREADDRKNWTRDAGSFSSLNWIWIRGDSMNLRTIRIDDTQTDFVLSERFSHPAGLAIWSPANGSIIRWSKSSGVGVDPPIDPPPSPTPDNRGQIISWIIIGLIVLALGITGLISNRKKNGNS